jgi:hypothetical protein
MQMPGLIANRHATPVQVPCSQTGSSSGCPGSGATCRPRKGCRHARSSIQAAPRLGSRREMSCASPPAGVAHAGHMKLEKPREDSWNWAAGRLRGPRMKSQGLADSWRLGENREWRAASLPRRRSPVRTRCSAPYGPGILEDFGAFAVLRQRRRPCRPNSPMSQLNLTVSSFLAHAGHTPRTTPLRIDTL